MPKILNAFSKGDTSLGLFDGGKKVLPFFCVCGAQRWGKWVNGTQAHEGVSKAWFAGRGAGCLSPAKGTCRLRGKSLRHQTLEEKGSLHWPATAIPVGRFCKVTWFPVAPLSPSSGSYLRHRSFSPLKTFWELIRSMMKSVHQLHMNILWRLTLRYLSTGL